MPEGKHPQQSPNARVGTPTYFVALARDHTACCDQIYLPATGTAREAGQEAVYACDHRDSALRRFGIKVVTGGVLRLVERAEAPTSEHDVSVCGTIDNRIDVKRVAVTGLGHVATPVSGVHAFTDCT